MIVLILELCYTNEDEIEDGNVDNTINLVDIIKIQY